MAAGRPQAVFQRRNLKVNGLFLAVIRDLRGNGVERRLHGIADEIRFLLLAKQLADHIDSFIDALDVLCVADDDLDARILKLLDLLLALRHRGHHEHLRLQRKDLLDVGVIAGLHGRNVHDLGRIVTVFTAADKLIARAEGIDDLAVRSSQGNDAISWLFQRDLAAGHIGNGHGSRFFLVLFFLCGRVNDGLILVRFRQRHRVLRVLCLRLGAACHQARQHAHCKQQRKKLRCSLHACFLLIL